MNDADITAPQTVGVTGAARGRMWLSHGWQPSMGWLRTQAAHCRTEHFWAPSHPSPAWVGCGARGFLWTSTPLTTAPLQFSSPHATPSMKPFFDEEKKTPRR